MQLEGTLLCGWNRRRSHGLPKNISKQKRRQKWEYQWISWAFCQNAFSFGLSVLKVSEFFSIVLFFSNGSYGLWTCFWTCMLFIVQFSRKGSSPFMWHSFRENAHLVLAFKIFFLKCKGKMKKVEYSLGKASWKMRRKNKSIFSNQICRCKQFHTRNVINNG